MSRMRPRRFASLCILASARQQASLRKTYGYSRPFFISLGVVTISSRAAHGGGGEKKKEKKRGERRVEKEPRVRLRTGERWCTLGIRRLESLKAPFQAISYCCDDSMSREIVTIFCRFSNCRLQGNCANDNFYGNACFCIRNIGKFFVVFPFVARYRRIKLKLG